MWGLCIHSQSGVLEMKILGIPILTSYRAKSRINILNCVSGAVWSLSFWQHIWQILSKIKTEQLSIVFWVSLYSTTFYWMFLGELKIINYGTIWLMTCCFLCIFFKVLCLSLWSKKGFLDLLHLHSLTV